MRKPRTIATAAAVVGLVLVAGLAAAQQQVPPELNADSLASRLDVPPGVREKFASRVDELSALFARQQAAREQMVRVWTDIQQVESRIAEILTPEQQRAFVAAVGRAWGYGHGMGMGAGMGMGMGMGAGHTGSHTMGIGYMRSGFMGGGPAMGAGHMMWGPMGRGDLASGMHRPRGS